MRTQKITYVQQHFALPSEAGFVRPWEFARRLQADGYRVTVIRGGQVNLTEEIQGVSIKTVKAPYANEMTFPRRIISFLQFVTQATGLVLLSKPDLIVASSTPLTVAIPAIVGSISRRTKFIFEVRDLWPEVPVALGLVTNKLVILAAKALEWITYRRADAIVTLSPYMEKGVLKVAPTAKTVMIPNGCDMAEFDDSVVDSDEVRAEAGVSEDETLIVYAGGFGYLYDLPRCVELAARLVEHKVRFTFIGRGSESEHLKNLAESLGIMRPGLFLGLKPKNDVIRFLKSSDLILSPLRSEPVLEGCSLNKVFDSMAARRPLLMNHGGWLAELIEEREAGFRISTDPDQAAAEILDILTDPVELGRRGLNNRALGEDHFSREDQYREFSETVSGVLSS